MMERLESLKAGIFAALAVICCHGFIALLGYGISQNSVIWKYNLYTDFAFGSDLFKIDFKIEEFFFNFFLGSAIAIASGFLFGATYRYVVRTDNNPHLQSGAVSAFALVRAMGQLQGNLQSLDLSNLNLSNLDLSNLDWIAIALIFGESFAWFASAAFILDLAMEKGWLKRFSGEME